ncbi:hypothetical protein JKG47_17905 [Acidithiobacillus sp. MC6.1]|nr:hypothetical protein [Acidithiobacillus sp. MC6.1]
MVIALIIGMVTVYFLADIFNTSRSQQALSNRVETANTLTSIMDHTVAMQGYYDASVARGQSVSIPSESPQPSASPATSITVYWLPNGAASSPYCQGAMSATSSGVNWTSSGPTGCPQGSVEYPLGAGWRFYVVSGTNCANNTTLGAQAQVTAIVASNASNFTEAASCLVNQP